MSRLSILFAVIFMCFASTAFAADDCEFCKKDHKSICNDECPKKDGKKEEGCMKKCFASKCAGACADKTPKPKKAEGDKKPKPAKKEGAAAPKESKKGK